MAQGQTQDIDLGITKLEYGDANRPQRATLVISTRKHYDGGLVSSATVYWIGEHSRSTCVGVAKGGDFGKVLKRSDSSIKATQKNIDRQHAEVFNPQTLQELTDAAMLHYAEQTA